MERNRIYCADCMEVLQRLSDKRQKSGAIVRNFDRAESFFKKNVFCASLKYLIDFSTGWQYTTYSILVQILCLPEMPKEVSRLAVGRETGNRKQLWRAGIT